MKKSISAVLFICILLAFVLPISASSPTSSCNDAIIITPDSFFQIFNTDHIDAVSYEYEFKIFEEDTAQAKVVLQTALTINNQTYDICTEGNINSYQLNDNDFLWEGPLEGSVVINGEAYSAIACFSLLDSTNESMVSITLQSNDMIAVVSFGANILTESVLDFFTLQANNNSNDLENNALNTQLGPINLEASYSANVVGDDFAPITHPGTGGTLNLGANGEWEYQSIEVKKHANTSYKALKSGVYFDDERNILMVTLLPFSNETNDYVQTMGYDFASASLQSFRVELILEDVAASKYAHIEFVDVPNDIPDRESYFDGSIKYLSLLFEDFISVLGVPTSTISAILDGLQGNIHSEGQGISAYIDITKSPLANYDGLDNLPYGLPFRFQLAKGSESNYIGNTPYTVNVYADYFVLAQMDVFMSDPIYYPFYVSSNITMGGVITLS